MRQLSVTFCLIIISLLVFSQEKKRLTHDEYAMWKQISSPTLSPDGNWLLYEVNPQDGDGVLVIRNLLTGQEEVVHRAQNAAVSPGGKYAVFCIKPGKAVERQAKADKKKSDEMPVDSLGIYLFESGQLIKYPSLESFDLPKESSDWLTYVIDQARLEKEADLDDEAEKGEGHEKQEEETTEQAEAIEEEDDEKMEEEKPGKVLYVANPLTGENLEVKRISAHVVADHGNLVAGLTEKKEKDTLSVWEVVVVETSQLEIKLADSRRGEMKQLNIDKAGRQLTWMFSADTTDQKSFAVYHHDVRSEKTDRLIYADMPGMPAGFGPGEHSKPYFSDNGQRLFVGTAPVPEAEPEDTLLAEEKYSLDIWHWQDPMLQSQQKVMVNQLRRRSYPAVYHFREARLVQLADEDMPGISMDPENETGKALGYSPVPYMIERQWTGGNARDLYVVNVADGSRKMVTERVEANAGISPAGQYLYWYETAEKAWMAYDMASETKVRLMDGVDVSLSNELHDLPMFARPYGLAGWTPGDREVLIYDRYDIWKVDPTGGKPAENITNGHGRENRVVMRIQNLDRDDHFVRLNDVVYLSGSDEVSRQSGYFRLNRGNLEKITMEDALLSGLQKAKDADRFIFRKSTYNDYADLWTAGPELSQAVKISEANPQQDDYYWGRVQVVEWQNFNNETLEGLLYLPEDLDESKTYPMLIYFYERSSQGLHQHFIPSPSRSTINRSYCTSNGYIVFVPDITYETGFPGESAYNAIVSGTNAMVERYPFIDRDNMGLQGQSWGGYQIAYLVTRTNMFKAAMAGAPVSNMVSAYGGIRWQTGVNRQFQYEQTQSRIGGTLWEKPLRYIENSPVFFADKIETPLLIMHNDDDGAVPWYQGIELFTAMRRLSKPVWMLVYNGEAHNLTKWPNRMDLSVRMYQFFDYYLKAEPAPAWLRHGIPAVDKGKVDAYELVE